MQYQARPADPGADWLAPCGPPQSPDVHGAEQVRSGKLLHRLVSPVQAEALRLSIANYRKVKKLLRAWEAETERLIDAENPRSS